KPGAKKGPIPTATLDGGPVDAFEGRHVAAGRQASLAGHLFLDEGFGALDTASLHTALDALAAAARRCRRLVAGTHLDAVTARADQVLGVTGSDAGSRAAWRSAALVLFGPPSSVPHVFPLGR